MYLSPSSYYISLVIIFAHCCASHCHTGFPIPHFTWLVDSQIVSSWHRCLVLWFVMSGCVLGCISVIVFPCSSGSPHFFIFFLSSFPSATLCCSSGSRNWTSGILRFRRLCLCGFIIAVFCGSFLVVRALLADTLVFSHALLCLSCFVGCGECTFPHCFIRFFWLSLVFASC